MKVLYYDCFSGISGDMNLGAMLDLGVDPSYLLDELKKIRIGSYEIQIQQDQRRGIAGTRFEVLTSREDSSRHERNYRDISRLIQESDLSEEVKDLSLRLFLKIGEAEARVHGCTLEEIHFHEVGAVDSIIDVVGAALCLDYLKADRVLSSAVELGGGVVRCAHGILPVPAPATIEMLKGIPVTSGAVPFEMTTPTGAAILAVTVHSFTDRMNFTPQKIGYGIGTRDTEIPNVLRLYLGELEEDEPGDDAAQEDAWLVECNIDDMNPELYEEVMDALLEKGARDVYLTPILMKKSRPAVTLSIICDSRRKKDMEEVLWYQTTTFGLRSCPIAKTMLKRELSEVETPYGPVTMKHGFFRGRKIKSKPEYADCKRIAREKGVSIREVLEMLASGVPGKGTG
ncbi:MAG: hypothetical protein A4E70_00820 [Syntrophus sp. PtaU1.Bin005]|uniref:nickel pincer cofactor biosynthesis protein LarC n=1 Tax=Syntrophus buswellii TaxID=43774 RepID=UPI0009CAD853|nr:MAG: hypothetical protein A4E70_00820 [Syntrophus sp. PtaU1.Bin005]